MPRAREKCSVLSKDGPVLEQMCKNVPRRRTWFILVYIRSTAGSTAATSLHTITKSVFFTSDSLLWLSCNDQLKPSSFVFLFWWMKRLNETNQSPAAINKWTTDQSLQSFSVIHRTMKTFVLIIVRFDAAVSSGAGYELTEGTVCGLHMNSTIGQNVSFCCFINRPACLMSIHQLALTTDIFKSTRCLYSILRLSPFS